MNDYLNQVAQNFHNIAPNVDFWTLRLTDEIALNIGANELLVGIEILEAKTVIGEGALPSVVLENIPLAKAA